MPWRFSKASLVLAALAAGCGGGGEARPDSTSEIVDASADPPYIGALSVNPRDGSLLLGTNAGTFLLRDGSRRLQRMRVRVTARGRSEPAEKGLAFTFVGPDELVGSGHPGPGRAVAPLLGFIRSRDGGRTWRSVSQLGQADLHALAEQDGRVIAADGVEAKVLVSEDGGKTFDLRPAPLLLTDLDVSPADGSKLVASTERGLHTSDDGGRTWRPGDAVPRSRFAWPAADGLFRVDPDGRVMRSADAGGSWQLVGNVEGESHALAALDSRRLYVADIEGTIRESRDGGRSWSLRARAPGT